MSRRKLIGWASLVWMLCVFLGGILFVGYSFVLGMRIAQWTGSSVAVVFAILISPLVGAALWIALLGVAWRRRRAYLRTAGAPAEGAITAARFREIPNRNSPFNTYQLRVEVAFTHPESGADHTLEKRYRFPEWHASKATSLRDRCTVGASIPLLVRRNHAAFDLPERPSWADIW
ncbi:hypothetical protein LTV02_36090 [Nocardia yamanashiensis]|uniref:hypothetical protein n=1 Tax=Nocardia yamanashiensis TaxID=209247 RepID=UPI001E51E978|nr:hypothetical protein [Nocardia yamanashiensis]UGT41296.1 hypothetical protein LTV02_36090 [Nocardia yamanashiensis]